MEPATLKRIIDNTPFDENIERGLTGIVQIVQWLADNDKISKKALDTYNVNINRIRAGVDTLNAFVKSKDDDATAARLKYESMHELKLKFEAVCLIHGITDLAAWINKPRELLIQLTIESVCNKWTQLPEKLRANPDAAIIWK